MEKSRLGVEIESYSPSLSVAHPDPLWFTRLRIVIISHHIRLTQKDKTPTIASEGFLILVGRARIIMMQIHIQTIKAKNDLTIRTLVSH